MRKIHSKVGIEGRCLNIRKAINDKPTANIIVNSEKLKDFSFTIRNKTGMSTFTPMFNIVLEVLATAIGQEKVNKRYPN